MTRHWKAVFLVTGLLAPTFFANCHLASAQPTQNVDAAPIAQDPDPYAWLEDVTGAQAIEWVKTRNTKAQAAIASDPSFEQLRQDLLAILDSDARIPFVSKRGEFYYNFWRDTKHERGLWRRTTLEEFKKAEPQWDVMLDLDELGKQEGEPWVWHGVRLLHPDYTRALISLSRGGADADVTREFDMATKSFVSDGFSRPESKGSMGWIDRDHVFIQTDFGPGSMTDSGYPRIAKKWTRGTPMDAAEVIYEGTAKDMSIRARHDDAPGFERNFVERHIAFYNDELYYIDPVKGLVKINIPNSAGKSVFHQYLAVRLRDAWEVGGKQYAAGSLLLATFDAFMQGDHTFEVAFEPTPTTALASFGFTQDYVFIHVLEDVKPRLYVLQQRDGGWTKAPLRGAPSFGSVSIVPVDEDASNEYFMTTSNYLTPTTLWMGTIGKAPVMLKQLPAFFDATRLEMSQHFATSEDGTRVPYFMVAPQPLKMDSNAPTLLYGYGGFEISLLPSYSAAVGRAWTSQGGVYVVANLRGGGEYGPRWHQAAVQENRMKAYQDFAAVARDLYERKITRKEKLGIEGSSNGGLLVGNMVTSYPDLFQAAVCHVPLLDMRRYNKLLAGASWLAEYGDPDDPRQWLFLKNYSPYHKVQANVQYPTILFMTSTRDDRVHPGHARKMMAKMEADGHAVYYYENIEGGHGGAATNRQAAFMQALAYTFLKQHLFGKD
jgi:prolyl oligopeptidase